MTIHSLVFVFIFLVGQYAQDKYPVAHQDMIRMIFLYSGALFVGLFAAYNRDRMDRENTRIRENLDEMNRDLQAANHDLLENERDLKNSEEKYRTLIEKAVDGIIITQKGLLKFVNSSFCKMIRYDQEELNEQPYLRFVHPEDHQMMIDYHNRRMKGEDFQVIYRSTIIRKDGSPLPVELNTRTSDYNGEPAAFIIVRDISERIRNEEDLRQATASLEELNRSLEHRIRESSEKLTEANTQLIRLQKENLQSQFEVLRQQVNPHFLFNSLNVLTSLIKLEPDLAEKYTEHLSKVYRYVLENKEHDLVRLEVELDFIDAYIFLLNIRFMGKIMITISVNEKSRNLLILPLALQLLIENAIKHNAMSKRNPLKINIYVDENRILHVENNLQERESYIASTGVGLKNIEHRYRLLEKPLPVFYKSESIFVAEIPLIASSN
ncbi:MAG: PAS domain S-box protein [Bacteroidetes bacterium]|nr:MAG: PAS domain S-box protein [Bacteroidota bacterium]